MPICGYCKGCRYWGSIFEYQGTFEGRCELAECGELNEYPHPQSLAHAVAGDEGASLFTRDGFGCLQWEAKEEKGA